MADPSEVNACYLQIQVILFRELINFLLVASVPPQSRQHTADVQTTVHMMHFTDNIYLTGQIQPTCVSLPDVHLSWWTVAASSPQSDRRLRDTRNGKVVNVLWAERPIIHAATH